MFVEILKDVNIFVFTEAATLANSFVIKTLIVFSGITTTKIF